MRATMTLWGLYNYDPTILEGLTPPQGVDRDTLIDNLLLETGELEIVYPTPDIMRMAVTAWSAKRSDAWTHMATALNAEYNPLENYDRSETWNDNEGETTERGRSTTSTTEGESESNTTGNESRSGETGDESTETNDVSAFNETSTYQPKDKTTRESTGTSSETSNNSAASTASSSGSASASETENTERDREAQRNGRVHGNIGVTTSQQMLESELTLRAKYDIISIIVDEFKTRFCLLVY